MRQNVFKTLVSIISMIAILSFSASAWTVQLSSPQNGTNVSNNNVLFTFNTSTDAPDTLNFTLMANFTGVWLGNNTNFTNIAFPVGSTRSIGVMIPDGNYIWNINATNFSDAIDYNFSAGNFSFAMDNRPPSVSFLDPLSLANVSRTINLTIAGTDPTTGIQSLRVQNGTNGNWIPLSLSAGTKNDGNWSVLFDTASVADGSLNLRLNATDYAGNSNSSEAITITIDNTHPKIFKYNGNVVSNAIVKGNISLNVTANDTLTGIQKLNFTITDNSGERLLLAERRNDFWNASIDATTLTDGVHNVTAQAYDHAGNGPLNRVVISEVAFNGLGSDSALGNEWIELYNPTSQPVTLSNWTIDPQAAGSTNFDIANAVIPPYSAMTFSENTTWFTANFGFPPDNSDDGFGTLRDAGDTIYLKNASGGIVDSVVYGDASITGVTANDGETIIRNPVSGDTDSESDWSSNNTATPGQAANPSHITVTVDNTPPKVAAFNGAVINNADLRSGTYTINATVTDATTAANAVYFAIMNSSGSQFQTITASNEAGSFWNASFDTTTLADGTYNITAYANDSLGNLNNTERITVDIDSTPPSLSVVTPLNNSFLMSTTPEIGFNITDSLSGVNTSSISFKYRFSLLPPQFDISNVAITPIPNGFYVNGTITDFGSQGVINITVNAKDNATNAIQQFSWSFTISFNAPSIPSVTINDTDNLVRSSDTLNITLNVSSEFAPIAAVNISNATAIQLTNISTGIWAANFTPNNLSCSADGACAVHITVIDAAGNINSSESFSLTIDNTLPSVTNLLISDIDNITRSQDVVTFNVTVTDAHFSSGKVTLGNASLLTLRNNTPTVWNITTPVSSFDCTQTDGPCILTLAVEDDAGNINRSERIAWQIDDAAPRVFNITTNDSNNIVKSTETINISVNITDTNAITNVSLNGTLLSKSGNRFSTVNSTSQFCPGVTNGFCQLTFNATDIAGNLNSSETLTFIVDETSPSVAALSTSDSDNIVAPTTVITLTANVSDSNGIASVFFNDTIPMLPASGNLYTLQNTTSYFCPGISDGACKLNFTAIDYAGNRNSTQTLTLTVDNSAPASPNFTQTPSIVTNSDNVTLNITWTDVNGIASVLIEHNATGNFTNATVTNVSNVYSATIPSSLIDNHETIAWRSTARDNAGTTTTTSLMFFTVTNRAPNSSSILPIAWQEETTTSINLSIYFADSDGDSLIFSITNPPERINATINGQIVTLTAPSDFFGLDYIVFNATDSFLSNLSNNVTLNVTDINDAPVVSAVSDIALQEDTSNTTLNLSSLVNDSDTPKSSITWSATIINNPNISVLINQSTKIANISSSNNFTGTAKLFFTANDGAASADTNLITVNVTPINDPPTATLLLSPGLNALVGPNVSLTWSPASDIDGVVSYLVVLNAYPNPNTTAAQTTSAAADITSLADQTYYWRVISTDGSLNTTSETRNFTVRLNTPPNITSVYPSTNPTIAENQTQRFNASFNDRENNIMTANWFVDNVIQSAGASSDLQLNHSFFNYVPAFNESGQRTVRFTVIDQFSQTTNYTWTITVSNSNRAPLFTHSLSGPDAREDLPYIFDINCTDPDNDSVTFATTAPGFSISGGNLTFIPGNNNVGTASANITCSDGSLSTLGTVSFLVINTNDAPNITSFSPSAQKIILNTLQSQAFSITSIDSDVGDTAGLATTWLVNNATQGTGSTFSFGPTSLAGDYSITARVRDNSNAEASRGWNLTVSVVPRSENISGSILNLTPQQAQAAANITIEKPSQGTIDFRNNILNLTNLAALDEVVKIEPGIIAIDTDRAPQLNRSAHIIMRGLSFTSTPAIYYNRGFNLGLNDSNTQRCPDSLCSNITYQAGTLEFDVAHFTTFLTGSEDQPPQFTTSPPTTAIINTTVVYDANAADPENAAVAYQLLQAPEGMSLNNATGLITWNAASLGRFDVVLQASDGSLASTQSFTIRVRTSTNLLISNVDAKVDSKRSSNLADGDSIRRDAEPESKVKFEIELENTGNTEMQDAAATIILEGIDDGDDDEEDTDSFNLQPGRKRSESVSFTIPLVVDEDTYRVIIRAEGTEANGTLAEDEIELFLDVNKNKHSLQIRNAEANPNPAICEKDVELRFQVMNLGEDDEDEVSIKASSPGLGFLRTETDISLDANQDEESRLNRAYTIPVQDIAPGSYPITITSFYDSKEESQKTVQLEKVECEFEPLPVRPSQQRLEPVQVIRTTTGLPPLQTLPAAQRLQPAAQTKAQAPTTQQPGAQPSQEKPSITTVPQPIQVDGSLILTFMIIGLIVLGGLAIYGIGYLIIKAPRRPLY